MLTGSIASQASRGNTSCLSDRESCSGVPTGHFRMNKLLDASSLRLPSAEVVALLIAIASLLFGLLVPIYTDEVGWRFAARSAIDGGVDRSVAENCGPNTLAIVPLFMQPLRYASATVNLAFADPMFVRLTGVTF